MQSKYLKYIAAMLILSGAGFALWPVSDQEVSPSQPAAGAPPQQSAELAPGQLPNLIHALTKANVQPIQPVAVPDFSLPDVTRREVRFSSFAGKVVMVNFWTTH